MEKIEDYRDPEVLKRLYLDEKLSMEQIAVRLYVSANCVKYYLDKYGIPTRHAKPCRVITKDGREWTYRQIAEASGTTPDAVKQRVRAGWSVEELFLPYGGRKRHARRLQRS